MEEEVKKSIYIGITLSIAAMVLIAIITILSIRDNAAQTINERYAMIESDNEYRKYNKYDNKIVYGGTVIELISSLSNEIEIYDREKNQLYNKSTYNSLNYKTLQAQFKNLKKYKLLLVYDNKNVKNVTTVQDINANSVVTGAVIIPSN